jgi:hypothetical protein
MRTMSDTPETPSTPEGTDPAVEDAAPTEAESPAEAADPAPASTE